MEVPQFRESKQSSNLVSIRPVCYSPNIHQHYTQLKSLYTEIDVAQFNCSKS